MLTRAGRLWLLAVPAAAALAAMPFVARISQDPAYHAFADTGEIAGIPNFWNVASNLPFLALGWFGWWRRPSLAQAGSRNAYSALCLGILLTGFGSAWYHLAPSNASLFWDRLPMTIAFMSVFALLLDERVLPGDSAPQENRFSVLWPLLVLGAASVVYWSWTEGQGAGDLRPYGLVQFLPVILIPLILFLFPARYLDNRWLFGSIALYALAKVLEYFDVRILQATGYMGGHALKHVAAALGALCTLLAVPTRRP